MGYFKQKGVADAVVTLAANARLADACATFIANPTFIRAPGVLQVKAETLDLQTNLVGEMVTKEVAALSSEMIRKSLRQGEESALTLLDKNIIKGAFIFIQGQLVAVPWFLMAKIINLYK